MALTQLVVENGKCSNSAQTVTTTVVLCISTYHSTREEARLWQLGIGKATASAYVKYQVQLQRRCSVPRHQGSLGRALQMFQVKSPNSLDTMINTGHYTKQKPVRSRFASFIEVGGRTEGLGYRDTAQDAISVPHANPAMTRKRRRPTRPSSGLRSTPIRSRLVWSRESRRRAIKITNGSPNPSDDDKIHGTKILVLMITMDRSDHH